MQWEVAEVTLEEQIGTSSGRALGAMPWRQIGFLTGSGIILILMMITQVEPKKLMCGMTGREWK